MPMRPQAMIAEVLTEACFTWCLPRAGFQPSYAQADLILMKVFSTMLCPVSEHYQQDRVNGLPHRLPDGLDEHLCWRDLLDMGQL